MDETAKMLEAYAGTLHQSFESVFERVGQSLSQSAQVMHMMNEVMESAMLQKLLISTSYTVGKGLHIEVLNDSQIMLGQMTIRAQMINIKGIILSKTFESLGAGKSVCVLVSLPDVAGFVEGFIELECISPGTQQPLLKRSLFQVLYLQRGTFKALKIGEQEAASGPNEAAATSNSICLARVRDLLNLSPIDGILTKEQGRYRFFPEYVLIDNTAVYISVKKEGEGVSAYHVTVSAAGSADTSIDRQRQCLHIIKELETIESESKSRKSNRISDL
ncbi:uncharacterized protein CCR75_001542 [Bremia lactucae]|uniref:Uncharacterized protein n=1 Tax=Bremia lactucae TaxID=4779 RepID=A0A976IB33_BRELC|nr:hypothetical protein CCR75_001542 [Bremia lactucae]